MVEKLEYIPPQEATESAETPEHEEQITIPLEGLEDTYLDIVASERVQSEFARGSEAEIKELILRSKNQVIDLRDFFGFSESTKIIHHSGPKTKKGWEGWYEKPFYRAWRGGIEIGDVQDWTDLLTTFHEAGHWNTYNLHPRKFSYKALAENAILVCRDERLAWAYALRAARRLKRERGVSIIPDHINSRELRKMIDEALAMYGADNHKLLQIKVKQYMRSL